MLLQRALASNPYDENERYRLGGWMERHATPEATIAYYRAEGGRDPKPQTSLFYWAVGLERSGQVDAAIGKLGQALEVDPAHETSENRLGTIYENQKHDVPTALTHDRNAVTTHPDFRKAYLNMARVLEALGRGRKPSLGGAEQPKLTAPVCLLGSSADAQIETRQHEPSRSALWRKTQTSAKPRSSCRSWGKLAWLKNAEAAMPAANARFFFGSNLAADQQLGPARRRRN